MHEPTETIQISPVFIKHSWARLQINGVYFKGAFVGIARQLKPDQFRSLSPVFLKLSKINDDAVSMLNNDKKVSASQFEKACVDALGHIKTIEAYLTTANPPVEVALREKLQKVISAERKTYEEVQAGIKEEERFQYKLSTIKHEFSERLRKRAAEITQNYEEEFKTAKDKISSRFQHESYDEDQSVKWLSPEETRAALDKLRDEMQAERDQQQKLKMEEEAEVREREASIDRLVQIVTTEDLAFESNPEALPVTKTKTLKLREEHPDFDYKFVRYLKDSSPIVAIQKISDDYEEFLRSSGKELDNLYFVKTKFTQELSERHSSMIAEYYLRRFEQALAKLPINKAVPRVLNEYRQFLTFELTNVFDLSDSFADPQNNLDADEAVEDKVKDLYRAIKSTYKNRFLAEKFMTEGERLIKMIGANRQPNGKIMFSDTDIQAAQTLYRRLERLYIALSSTHIAKSESGFSQVEAIFNFVQKMMIDNDLMAKARHLRTVQMQDDLSRFSEKIQFISHSLDAGQMPLVELSQKAVELSRELAEYRVKLADSENSELQKAKVNTVLEFYLDTLKLKIDAIQQQVQLVAAPIGKIKDATEVANKIHWQESQVDTVPDQPRAASNDADVNRDGIPNHHH